MAEFTIRNHRYTYIHDSKYPSEAIDTHIVVLGSSNRKRFIICLVAFVLLVNTLVLFKVKDISISILLWIFLLSAIFVKLLVLKPVVKESVVVMPAFGVQLETHYMSGRIERRFVPIDKILKPVLIECVNPVTCYWSLSLILRGEAELLLVFKELRPPVKMLIHIWKALCRSSGCKENPGTSATDG
ncbi:uncharacterized protein LOC126670206 [Mercurialis annua]|uniref:uncharacterized protein LOC126670206 n=1 Tax=Mercurialis annua TaxID=3986 RepID=UPI00215EE03C|nr:uncharacterized protein LOC126670206 [Mercurialis annua]XP_050219834.1 uncharacterized protein LOC126670206 [Mercurialis annua]